MKPTILVDMDGVFADFVAGFYSVLEANHPEARKHFPDPDKLVHFYIEDNLSDPSYVSVSDSIVDHIDTFQCAPPFPGAIEGMNLLRDMAEEVNADVRICTAPHLSNIPCYSQKAAWVSKYLDRDWLDRLIITRDKTLVRGHVLLDDKPEPLGTGVPMWDHILFTRSYNANIPNRLRINSWEPDQLQLLINHAFAKSMAHLTHA